MDDFSYEVIERKRLAGQAKYKKCGSRSKRCSLLSDKITNKQWKERCGEVLTYQTTKPMHWSEFKSMPVDIQTNYIDWVRNKYHPTALALAYMFGVGRATLIKYCAEKNINLGVSRGHSMSAESRSLFEEFVHGSTTQTFQNDVNSVVEDGNVENYQWSASKEMKMNEFAIKFSGEFSKSMMYNSIMQIIQDGTPVDIEIKCRMLYD